MHIRVSAALRGGSFFAALLLAAAALAQAPTTTRTRVTFILVNDIYQMGSQVMADGRARGGFARLARVVKSERARGGHVIFAHGGDTLSPSLMSGIDRGEHIIRLTNLIPPDIFVPGNHEFDFGKATFLTRMAEAKFPLYAANLRAADGKPLTGFKDRAILTFEGVRIGLTGAASDESPRSSSPEDLKFASTVATMKEQAAALRREGADFVVAVIHASRKQDYELYESRAIDLILSGHNHDLFVNFDGRTAMAESSSDAHYVTMIDVNITVSEEGGRRQTTWWPEFRVVDTATVQPDFDVVNEVVKYETQLARELNVTIATVAGELDSRSATVRAREAAIGNLIADTMRAAVHADVAVTNGGSIRGQKVYPDGSSVTRRDILTELPFNNRIVLIELSGRDLKAAIEHGISAAPQPSGRFPQVSGMKVEAELARPAGARIVTMTVGGAPLDETKMYKVAINDFLARGGDGYVAFRDAKRLLPEYDGLLLAMVTMEAVRAAGKVTARVEGRLTLK